MATTTNNNAGGQRAAAAAVVNLPFVIRPAQKKWLCDEVSKYFEEQRAALAQSDLLSVVKLFSKIMRPKGCTMEEDDKRALFPSGSKCLGANRQTKLFLHAATFILHYDDKMVDLNVSIKENGTSPNIIRVLNQWILEQLDTPASDLRTKNALDMYDEQMLERDDGPTLLTNLKMQLWYLVIKRMELHHWAKARKDEAEAGAKRKAERMLADGVQAKDQRGDEQTAKKAKTMPVLNYDADDDFEDDDYFDVSKGCLVKWNPNQ